MYSYIVVEQRPLSDSSILLTVRPRKSGRTLKFAAGQYAAINFKMHGRPTSVRCFSIVSDPSHSQYLQFGLRVTGDFTATAAVLRPGDHVQVRGPYGHFLKGLRPATNAVFFAGGIGITPFMSHLRQAAALASKGRIVLVYSCQRETDMPFVEELMALESSTPRLTIVYAISSGAVDQLARTRVITGRLTQDALDRIFGQNFSSYQYYLCGPKPFMRSIEKSLRLRGVSAGHIQTEEFGVPAKKLWPPQFGILGKTYATTALALLAGTSAVLATDVSNFNARLADKAVPAPVQPVAASTPAPLTTPTPSPVPTPAPTTAPAAVQPTPAPTAAPVVQSAPVVQPTPVATAAPTPVSTPYTPPVSRVS